ncbi:MAG TPA: amidohydrolase family protein [Myxococcota bacterium]
MNMLKRWAPCALLCAILACSAEPESTIAERDFPPADHVFLNGKIYTADANRSVAQAIAVSGNVIVFVGDDEAAPNYIGEQTEIHELAGKLVLPGLHDAHLHPEGVVQPDVCDLQSKPMTLEELVSFLRGCIEHYEIADGEWLIVPQWSFSIGNQPNERYPTLVAALDAASATHPILLVGNDGHHAAVNSRTLATAVNAEGKVVGLSRETLATDFSEYRDLIAVDAGGHPSGGVTETAVSIFDSPDIWNLVPMADIVGDVAKVLASRGITSIVDAMASRKNLDAYHSLEQSGEMTFRVRAAQFEGYYTPKSERGGIESIPQQIEHWNAQRSEFSNSQYIRADSVKVFADGVIEGNPLIDPPTLPNAASLEIYKQPRFAFDPKTGRVDVVGYVDTTGDACRAVRANPAGYEAGGAVSAFVGANGHHPGQCVESRGVLEFEEEYLHAYVDALYAAGFSVHIHAIGDRAVRVAIDSLEAARQSHGDNGQPHGLAHAQLIHPDDQKRIGEMGLFVAFTHSWSTPEPEYMMTVVPFIDELENGAADLHHPDNYYMKNAYPVRSLEKLGALITSGSDAPVERRDPAPFLHIEQAITRDVEGRPDIPVLNGEERLDIHSSLAAYTINGARAMSQADRLGSLEVGKLADLIVVDRDVLALAEGGRAHDISETRVLLTLFDGNVVFEAEPLEVASQR